MEEQISLIIACEAFKDELEHFKDVIEVEIAWIERSLHDLPSKLNMKIRAEIGAAEKRLAPGSTVLLFFGSCGGAMEGLQSETLNLIYPDVDDCIPIILGSMEKYSRLRTERPGTFYLNKAWIDSGDDPLGCARKYGQIYGEEKGLKVTKKMYRSYTHFMLIDNGSYEPEPYRKYVKEVCALFEKEYAEEKGSLDLVSAVLNNRFRMRMIPSRQQKLENLAGDKQL